MYVAGIVLYNPEIEKLNENINAIYDQVDRIALIDNASNNLNKVEMLWKSDPKIDFIYNKKNMGIAVALNQIVAWAAKLEYRWVLLLDQDSVCGTNLVQKLGEYCDISSVGIISPVIWYVGEKKQRTIGKSHMEVNFCITSGSLINIRAWSDIGGADERMFIDMVDYDYCYRMRKKNYKIFRVDNAILRQQLGNAKIYHLGNRHRLFITYHAPFRCFYIGRNFIYLLRKYKSVTLYIYLFKVMIEKIVTIFLFENDKRNKLCSLFRGMLQGRNVN